MKKILCLVLAAVMILSLTACGSNNLMEKNDKISLYQNYTMDKSQGKINGVYYVVDHLAFNVDGTIKEFGNNFNLESLESIDYSLGDYAQILLHSPEVTVVEQKDGSVRTIVAERDLAKMECETHEVTYQDINKDTFVYAGYENTDNKTLFMVYKDGNEFMYKRNNLDGSEIDSGKMSDILSGDIEGYEIDELIYTSYGDLYTLNKNNEIRSVSFGSDAIYLFAQDTSMIPEIDEWLVVGFGVDIIVTHTEDDSTLYFYHREDGYKDIGTVKLPKEYKTNNIKNVVELYSGLLVEFDDGEYYLCDYSIGITTNKFEKEPTWRQPDGFKNLIKDGQIVELMGQLCVLKNDGKLYTYDTLS